MRPALLLGLLLVPALARADASPPPAPDAAPACFAPQALDRAIRCGGNTCLLDRRLLECWLSHEEHLARSVRIIPVLTDGRPEGFKLYAIRPGSFFARLGLRNGDTLRRVNGLELTSPERALEVYASLRARTDEEMVVELTRRDIPLTLRYRLR